MSITWGIVVAFFMGSGLGFILARILKKPDMDNGLLQRLDAVVEERNRIIQQKTETDAKIIELVEQLATFKAQKIDLEERLLSQKAEIESVQKKLTSEFENLCHKIFKDHTMTFKQSSSESLDHLLSPLKENLKSFTTKVETYYGNENKDRAVLLTEIKNVMSANQEITKAAQNLTNALKGDSKVQGNWGELVLEKVLEASGLRDGEEYTIQGKKLGLSDEDGNNFRPDVIVHLPDGKHIIIDSKVSLKNYEAMVGSEDLSAQKTQSKELIESTYRHIKNLSEKKYHHLEQLISPEIVLMFVPLEGAFNMMMREEKALLQYGWDRHIVLVTPTTLFATLRTIGSLWKRERQNKNAMEIARQAGSLYDKFADFVSDLDNIDTNLKRTEKSLDDAMNKLKTGKGNLLSRAEKINQLGAKSSKTLPAKHFIEDTDDADGFLETQPRHEQI